MVHKTEKSHKPVELRVTQGAVVTEEKGEFLGLPDGLIFVPLGVFMVVMLVSENFLAAVIFTIAFYGVIRIWLRRKPRYWLKLWLWHIRAPMIYRHRMMD